MKTIVILTLLFIIGGYLPYRHFNPNPPHKQAFINGQILTMNKNSFIAEAVLIEGDHILSVGSNEEIRKQIDDKTTLIDLALPPQTGPLLELVL